MAETLLLADVTVSSAQLLDLHNTPVEVIAGSPTNVIIVHRVVQEYTFGLTRYVETLDGVDMGLRLSAGMTIMRDTIVTGSGSNVSIGDVDAGSMNAELLADMAGEGLEYYSIHPLVGGDGSLRLLVYYTLLTV